jgi:hypothetical protein
MMVGQCSFLPLHFYFICFSLVVLLSGFRFVTPLFFGSSLALSPFLFRHASVYVVVFYFSPLCFFFCSLPLLSRFYSLYISFIFIYPPPSLCFSGCFYRAKSEFFKISSLSSRIVILYRDSYCFRFALYLVE